MGMKAAIESSWENTVKFGRKENKLPIGRRADLHPSLSSLQICLIRFPHSSYKAQWQIIVIICFVPFSQVSLLQIENCIISLCFMIDTHLFMVCLLSMAFLGGRTRATLCWFTWYLFYVLNL